MDPPPILNDLFDTTDEKVTESLEYLVAKQQRIHFQTQINKRAQNLQLYTMRYIGGPGDYPPHDDYNEWRMNFKWYRGQYFYCGKY